MGSCLFGDKEQKKAASGVKTHRNRRFSGISIHFHCPQGKNRAVLHSHQKQVLSIVCLDVGYVQLVALVDYVKELVLKII